LQVEHFLEHSASRLPDKVALVCGDRRVTYRELDREADRVAALLREHGVRRRARVLIQLANGVEAVVSVFAVLKAGAMFVMVNPSVKVDKLGFLLNNSRATAFICDAARMGALEPLWDGTPHLRTIVAVGQDGASPSARGKGCASFRAEPPAGGRGAGSGAIDVDLAALVYTSGSTGQPKGVMLTHHNIVTAATTITAYLGNRESDVILNTLPLSFDYGLYQVLMAFKTGASLVLEPSFTYPRTVLETLVRERVTGFPIVPTIAAILLQLDLREYDFSALRYISSTGASLPVEHIRELRRRLPHVSLYSMYGLTECKRVSYLPPDQIDLRPDSVGKGMANQEVYIVDEHGHRLKSGVGELVVRGSNVMKGYWELPEETDRVLKPGPLPGERVLHSGDIFRMDEEGYLYFVGRKDDIIKTRGEKVSPKEVENVVHAMPGIADVVVLGVADAILGEAVKAVVALREGASVTAQDVLRHCSRRLEDFMVPKIVEFRGSLPRTPSGKVDKKALLEQEGSALTR
jgi:amino acid adenylation domain-containing protein